MNRKGMLPMILVALSMPICAGPAAAQRSWNPGDAGSVRFGLGLFVPQANSSYWDEKFDVWTGDGEDFQDLVWHVDGVWMFSPTMGLQFGTSWYRGDTTQSYREWTDANGAEVSHRTELQTWDLTAAWVFKPGSGNSVRPYFGLGGGLCSWRLDEYGDFIDFGAAGPPPIITAGYSASGTTFMAFAIVGLEIYTHGPCSFFLEGRWKHADASLGGDFGSLQQRLDLSGGELSGGIALNF
jgi:hypothetical protein